MSRFRINKGFSLIELMVVMAIVAVLLTLTGGVVQKNIAQQERIVELEKVSQLFKQLSYQSYYGKGPINVRLQESQIVVTVKEDIINEESYVSNIQPKNNKILFNRVVFVAQDYVISSKGIVSPDSFGVIFNDDIKSFPIKAIFNEITEK
jgi:prepilin-type N-terminal cleavage/methylation domain-containing protein